MGSSLIKIETDKYRPPHESDSFGRTAIIVPRCLGGNATTTLSKVVRWNAAVKFVGTKKCCFTGKKLDFQENSKLD